MVCTDARENGVWKATGSYRTYLSLVKLQPWFGSWVCSERLALGQNTLMMIMTRTVHTEVGQVAQAARRWAMGWTDPGSIPGVGGVEIFLRSFASRLVLKSTQPPIK